METIEELKTKIKLLEKEIELWKWKAEYAEKNKIELEQHYKSWQQSHEEWMDMQIDEMKKTFSDFLERVKDDCF